MNSCAFIILGATGDLTKRKLIPAIYRLVVDKKIENFVIIGAALDDLEPHQFLKNSYSFIRNADENILKKIEERSYYQSINFADYDGFIKLNNLILSLEKKYSLSGNRLVYLATAAHHFSLITKSLGRSRVVAKSDNPVSVPWQRIVYEKPFGTSEQTALKTNQCITEWFNEDQIYRVDHYLTKELVSNIVLVRFTNIIFEPLWNKNYIDHVQIIMSETIGLENRGSYYDYYGIVKDIIQNHIMQLLSLVAMELPGSITAHDIKNEKAHVLQKVRVIDGVLGQYEGYTLEKDINPHSQTPTFACLKMVIDTPRWQDVPFYVKAGKRLDKKDTSIHIKFKNVDCTLKQSCLYESDYLSIQIEPDASFSLQLNIKHPESIYEVTPIILSFSHNYVYHSATPQAYEILLEQVMAGERSVTVRFDEIEYAWRVIDTIAHLNLPLYRYKQLSTGPEQLETFNQRYGLRWRA